MAGGCAVRYIPGLRGGEEERKVGQKSVMPASLPLGTGGRRRRPERTLCWVGSRGRRARGEERGSDDVFPNGPDASEFDLGFARSHALVPGKTVASEMRSVRDLSLRLRDRCRPCPRPPALPKLASDPSSLFARPRQTWSSPSPRDRRRARAGRPRADGQCLRADGGVQRVVDGSQCEQCALFEGSSAPTIWALPLRSQQPPNPTQLATCCHRPPTTSCGMRRPPWVPPGAARRDLLQPVPCCPPPPRNASSKRYAWPVSDRPQRPRMIRVAQRVETHGHPPHPPPRVRASIVRRRRGSPVQLLATPLPSLAFYSPRVRQKLRPN